MSGLGFYPLHDFHTWSGLSLSEHGVWVEQVHAVAGGGGALAPRTHSLYIQDRPESKSVFPRCPFHGRGWEGGCMSTGCRQSDSLR